MAGEDPFQVSEAPPQDQRPDQGLRQPSLLELRSPAAVVERMMREWDDTHPYVRNLIEQWKVNGYHSAGYTGVKVVKQQDDHRAYIPWGATPNLAAMNQAARLKRKVRAFLFADPPLPEATPSTGEDEDRDTAELSTRVLHDLTSEGNLSYTLKAGDAFDCGSDYGSGFIRFWVDPKGGGWRPHEIMAAPLPQATAAAPLRDPATGQEWADERGKIPDPVRRYVREDGTLTDDRNDDQIAKQWLPKIRDEELDGRHVRFIPSTARDLWDADGVMIGAMVPLGNVKQMFPEVMARLTDEQLGKLASARPAHVQDLLPRGRKDTGAGTITDETLVFVLARYHTQGAEYPKGAYLVAAGDDLLLHRQEWWDAEHGEPLDPPLTQFAQFNQKDNPYKVGLMELLGPGNELRAFLFGYILEHLDRLSSRKVFLDPTGTIQPEQMQSPTATTLWTRSGTEPKYEQLPTLPDVVAKLWEEVKEDLTDESGLQEQAQGLNTPGVKSGLHAQTIIEQVVQGLSDLRQNTERGLVRGWRVLLQLVRAFYTVPQIVKWKGDDGAFQVKEYTGADLGSTRDVRINKGSFTQLAPSAKAALAEQLFQFRDPQTGEAIVSLEELRHIVAGNVGGLLGVQDNPHLLRVRRQISRWRDGPPDGWEAPEPQVDPETEQQVPVPDPVLAGIFEPIPADEEPSVARLRTSELGRAMASTRFARWPVEWQRGLAEEYVRMRQAAGIVTVREQQEAARQQAQQEEEAAAQQQQAVEAAEERKAALERDRLAQQRETEVAEVTTEALKAGAAVGAKP